MAIIKVKTKTNVNIDQKPRVYFTCHPDDFEKYFEKICDDIFQTHDCAIYYTEDMTELIDEEDKETDLGRNNLFIVPVTFKLLKDANRAMDNDIPYAKKEHIPVLPIMMEPGIDAIYALPDKFGEIQYLNPYRQDISEISYEEKLEKYLESVLIGKELAERIRAAFDAYIFLSYRKKDRRYANELIRIIHKYPECRDIAIWFDEFLTPGESFKEGISRILHDSKLFALLVTPNLLEEPDGKPNFVMGMEYPEARKSGIDIFPAEMEETDKSALSEKFEGLPPCINPHDDEAFKTHLFETITNLAVETNDTPEHNYLIGLAYLDGIDVEVNRKRALELITSAAEADLPEAMITLHNMYNEGVGVELDYRKAVIWAKALADYMAANYGEEDSDTLTALNNLAVTYDRLGDFDKAMAFSEKAYNHLCRVSGEENSHTLSALCGLVSSCMHSGDYKKALKLAEKAYALRSKTLGEEHPDTLNALNNLVLSYHYLGDYKTALKFAEKSYNLNCKKLGEEHPQTLCSLVNLARLYNESGDYETAFKFEDKAYKLYSKNLGEEHPDTLKSLSNLSTTYANLGDYETAFKLSEKVNILRSKTLGEKHPSTLESLSNLAMLHNHLGNHKAALELAEKAYTLNCEVLGDEHPITLLTLCNLAVAYAYLNDSDTALELAEKACLFSRRVLGEEHPTSLNSLSTFATIHAKHGNPKAALQYIEKVYSVRDKKLGEKHPSTMESLSKFAEICNQAGDRKRALELYVKLYILRCKVSGSDHRDTLRLLTDIAEIDGSKALELIENEYNSRCKILGKNHASTLSWLNFLASFNKKYGDVYTAQLLYEKLYDLGANAFGTNHSGVVKTQNNINKLKKKTQKKKKKKH